MGAGFTYPSSPSPTTGSVGSVGVVEPLPLPESPAKSYLNVGETLLFCLQRLSQCGKTLFFCFQCLSQCGRNVTFLSAAFIPVWEDVVFLFSVLIPMWEKRYFPVCSVYPSVGRRCFPVCSHPTNWWKRCYVQTDTIRVSMRLRAPYPAALIQRAAPGLLCTAVGWCTGGTPLSFCPMPVGARVKNSTRPGEPDEHCARSTVLR